jgi:integrase
MAASLLLSQGVNIKIISEILGHADTSLTARTYSHIFDPERQYAASKMDQILGRQLQASAEETI